MHHLTSEKRHTSLGADRSAPPAIAIGVKATAVIVAVLAGLLCIAFLWGSRAGHSPEVLLRDPSQRLGYWPFAGAISYLGILAMWAAGVVCAFASLHAHEDRALLMLVGAYSKLLATDDLFVLHEYFWPRRGIPTVVAQAAYLAIGASILLGAWKTIRGWENVPLHVALVLLGASLALDLIMPYSTGQLMVEDSFKFVGLLLWSAYWIARAGARLG